MSEKWIFMGIVWVCSTVIAVVCKDSGVILIPSIGTLMAAFWG